MSDVCSVISGTAGPLPLYLSQEYNDFIIFFLYVRARLKETYDRQAQENRQLRELNERLLAEKALLKNLIMEHLRCCPNAAEMSELFYRLRPN